jgi:iron complex transport system substrate-binding protein
MISLSPVLTESICALSACERLVAVDRSSNHPAQVRDLPKAGGVVDPNLELIVSLRPDVVLTTRTAQVIDRLEKLGIAVVAFEPQSQAQAQATYLTLGAWLKVPDAAQRWQRAEALAWAAARRQMPASPQGLRVYIEVASDPYAAGAASFMGELTNQLGWLNVVPAALGPFPRLNPEFVLRANPEVIVTTSTTLAQMAARPGWAQIDAIARGRVCVLKGDEVDTFSRPGPRLSQAAVTLARCAARWSQPASTTQNDGAAASSPR